MSHPAGVFQLPQDDDPRTVAGCRLAARLGAGGMGRVCLSHIRGGRPVAVNRNGDVALMVIETTSSALPDIGFLTTD
ncbi:hypothetical protein [Streptomyces sp. NPDC005930]|uniref:hypothetical protein n=1 Tax=Streptomyces sp. NPDC005930 TaxID=3364736 RepID=UPI0036B7ABB5